MASKPSALGIHIYAGGFTLGIRRHFDVVGHWEEIPVAGIRTARRNFGEDFVTLSSPSEWPMNEHQGRHELVYANPPCVAWSSGGTRLGEEDPRSLYTPAVGRTLMDLEPTIAMMESVPRAWTGPGRSTYDGLAEEFRHRGYAVTVFLTSSILHGAPQVRERFHFIAHRVKLVWPVPKVLTLDGVRTVRDAIEDLETGWTFDRDEPTTPPNHVLSPMTIPRQRVIDASLPDESLNSTRQRLIDGGAVPEDMSRFSFQQRRLHYDRPARVMAAQADQVHPTQHRMISTREVARLCDFPDDFVFVPPTEKAKRLRREDVTQGVLPSVAEYLGRMAAVSLDVAEPAKPGPIVEVDLRDLGRDLKRQVVATLSTEVA